MPVHIVRSLRRVPRVTASLDEPVAEDGACLGELLSDEHALDPAVSAVEVEDLRPTSRSGHGLALARSAVARSSARRFNGCAR